LCGFDFLSIIDKDDTSTTEVYSWAEVPVLVFGIFDDEGPYVAKVLPLASAAHASVVETCERCVVDVTVAARISEGVYVCLEPIGVVLLGETVSVPPGLVAELCGVVVDYLADGEAAWHHQAVLECPVQVVLRRLLLQGPHRLLVATGVFG